MGRTTKKEAVDLSLRRVVGPESTSDSLEQVAGGTGVCPSCGPHAQTGWGV